jgi:hypothetical protein
LGYCLKCSWIMNEHGDNDLKFSNISKTSIPVESAPSDVDARASTILFSLSHLDYVL